MTAGERIALNRLNEAGDNYRHVEQTGTEAQIAEAGALYDEMVEQWRIQRREAARGQR